MYPICVSMIQFNRLVWLFALVLFPFLLTAQSTVMDASYNSFLSADYYFKDGHYGYAAVGSMTNSFSGFNSLDVLGIRGGFQSVNYELGYNLRVNEKWLVAGWLNQVASNKITYTNLGVSAGHQGKVGSIKVLKEPFVVYRALSISNTEANLFIGGRLIFSKDFSIHNLGFRLALGAEVGKANYIQEQVFSNRYFIDEFTPRVFLSFKTGDVGLLHFGYSFIINPFLRQLGNRQDLLVLQYPQFQLGYRWLIDKHVFEDKIFRFY